MRKFVVALLITSCGHGADEVHVAPPPPPPPRPTLCSNAPAVAAPPAREVIGYPLDVVVEPSERATRVQAIKARSPDWTEIRLDETGRLENAATRLHLLPGNSGPGEERSETPEGKAIAQRFLDANPDIIGERTDYYARYWGTAR